MQVVYRARSLSEANSARDYLDKLGISAHVADESHWAGTPHAPLSDVVRVMVDNRRLDQARRALHQWKPA